MFYIDHLVYCFGTDSIRYPDIKRSRIIAAQKLKNRVGTSRTIQKIFVKRKDQ